MIDSAGLRTLCDAVSPARRAEREAVRRHLDDLTKPPGSLGRLEDVALRLALILGDPPPSLRRRVVYVLAADHGVAKQGISAYPAEVTAQMCRNYVAGGAAINAFARAVGAEVVTVDVGVDADLGDLPGLVVRKVRRGTRDLTEGPAMTEEETLRAIAVGISLVRDGDSLPDVVALGEMGIGNTTAASALTAAWTGAPAASVVGPGTGLDRERLGRKLRLVEQAVTRVAGCPDPLHVLAEVGGLEIAGLAGVTLAAAAAGRPVVTDGFIATAAALAAGELCPTIRDYLFASHCSTEPGHRIQLSHLGLQPLFDLGLRLGEGTGAALALPWLEAAGALLREMATFSAAGVSSGAARESI